MIHWKTYPSQSLSGKLRLLGDKSISHRAIMLASLAEGDSKITGFLSADDCLATLNAFKEMGVVIEQSADDLLVHGVGLYGLKPTNNSLYLGNSGTAMRLLAGILAGQRFCSTLLGDASLSKRPMLRLAKPLRRMGADMTTAANGCAPIQIKPVKRLNAISYTQPVASAQIKSALLLAGLYCRGNVQINEPQISRNHTENMLNQFGCKISSTPLGSGIKTKRLSFDKLTGCSVKVPGDISSAAFFIVAALIAQSEITLAQVGINPTRTGIITILEQMGANIGFENVDDSQVEPVADIVIKPSYLKGIMIEKQWVSLAIDEFPVIFIAAACADGEFILKNAKELRVKESDRIESMIMGLKALGVNCHSLADGVIIRGNSQNPFPRQAIVDSVSDHRVAMAFAVAGIRATHSITILNCQEVATSFPHFLEKAMALGMHLSGDIK